MHNMLAGASTCWSQVCRQNLKYNIVCRNVENNYWKLEMCVRTLQKRLYQKSSSLGSSFPLIISQIPGYSPSLTFRALSHKILNFDINSLTSFDSNFQSNIWGIKTLIYQFSKSWGSLVNILALIEQITNHAYSTGS